MKILAIDPSGNFKEGSGKTGLCYGSELEPKTLMCIEARDFKSSEEYTSAIIHDCIALEPPDFVVIEGYRLYNYKGMSAATQSFSALETPQLIGAIKYACTQMDIPVYEQMAHEVMTRWCDSVLRSVGIITRSGNLSSFNGAVTNVHMRDALRHYMHFITYKLPKIMKEIGD